MSQTPETDPRFIEPPKNLKVLQIFQPQELRMIIEHFNASLGVRCTFCHNRDDLLKDTLHIGTARKMI